MGSKKASIKIQPCQKLRSSELSRFLDTLGPFAYLEHGQCPQPQQQPEGAGTGQTRQVDGPGTGWTPQPADKCHKELWYNMQKLKWHKFILHDSSAKRRKNF